MHRQKLYFRRSVKTNNSTNTTRHHDEINNFLCPNKTRKKIMYKHLSFRPSYIFFSVKSSARKTFAKNSRLEKREMKWGLNSLCETRWIAFEGGGIVNSISQDKKRP